MDIFTEPAKEAVSKLGDLAVKSTVKRIKYLVQQKDIISNLKEEHEKLIDMKLTLQGRVDAERRKGNEIAPNVLKWLSNVGALENELQSFYENEVNMNKKCFGGQCPDLAFKYSLGKRATKSTEYITSLKEEEKKIIAADISYPKAPPPLGSTFVEDIKSLESRNKIIAEVIEKLKDDKLKRISICGMGGAGKTTLVKELIQIVEKSKLFDVVVMAVVSQNPNYKTIQSQIADGLGLELTRESMEGRARQLLQNLEEKDNILIVLDDVWGELKFECIGLPSRDHQKGCKILFTSRDEKVCQKMGSQMNFQVSMLLDDEAWCLFREMAGEIVDKPDIHPIAKEVAHECAGLPLALVIVGRALGNEEKLVWQVALQRLRNSQSSSFLDMQEFVYSRIELSINFLDSEHRSCLLLCGLFPEDFDIPVECLLHHGIGLELFEAADAVWKARNQVNYLVSNLKRCFLLLDSHKPGCFKIHDVVRDVILKIESRDEHGILVQSNAELKRLKQGKWLTTSLIFDEKFEFENDLKCPTLELLQVRSVSKTPIPWIANFMQGMNKLKVLTMQNLCIPKMSSLSQASVNLHTLQVEGCDVGDISVIGKELKKLEILSFANSNIKELPTEIGLLRFLRLLDLTGCDDLNFISANVLARLSRLEELYFRVENFPWMLNKVVLEELRNLSQQLKVLEIKVNKVPILPDNLIFRNLEKFWVYVVPYNYYKRHGYLESNVLQFKATDYNSIKCSLTAMQLVKKCEILVLEKVKDLKNVINELDDSGLQNLKDLRLDYCPNLEHVMDCSTPCGAFPLIKSLSLNNLTKLREIFCASRRQEIKSSMIGFSELEELKLIDLPNLIGFDNTIDLNELHQPTHHGLNSTTKLADSTNVEDGEVLIKPHSESQGCRSLPINAKLFPFSWMTQFQKLETILLQGCKLLEMVFDLQGYSQSHGQSLALLFPQLKKIKMSYLNNLAYVWGDVPHYVQGFQNLRSLTILHCDSLRYIFPSTIVRAIVHLEELEVSSCESIENLVVWSKDDEEDNNKGKGQGTNTVFNKLHSVTLSKLPKLVSTCSDSLNLECPSLRQLTIDDCPMLEISLLPSHIHLKQDNFDVTYLAKVEDTGFHSLRENNSRLSGWPLRCMPFLPKFIPKGNTRKKSMKEVSLARDHVPSIFEMKSKKEKGHVPILEDLNVRKCDLLDALFFLEEEDNITIPSHLKTIKIEECDKLETIVAKSEERKDMINCFTQLESLHLKELSNLLRFCSSATNKSLDKQQDMDAYEGDHERIRRHPFIDEFLFPNLTSLFIEACNKISILFSHSCLSSLEHLEKLEVWHCVNMEEIVSQEEIEASANSIIFPGMQHLALKGLPNLKAFCQGSHNFNFPSLKEVKIEDCPNMEVFSQGSSHTPNLEDVIMKIEPHSHNYIQNKDLNATIQGFKAFVALQESEMLRWTELHNKGILGDFKKNSEINIIKFHKLSKLVSFNEIQMLQHVRKLTIEKCDSLVEVFESEGGEGAKKGDATTQYQLEYLTLEYLPKLSHIWKDNIIKGVVSFQKLTSIYIQECHSLKSLFSHSMARSLVHLQSLWVDSCDMIEEIVTKEDENNEGGSKVKKILFPQLKILRLYSLPELECVCSGDYDYDIPLCDVGEDKEMNNNKIQISFPQLKFLELNRVPKLKCICSGGYDYNIMVSSIEECPKIATFPHGNVIVSAPNLHSIVYSWSYPPMRTLGDLNLTIHYLHNSEKYQVELQKLETFEGIEQHELLLGYITRQERLFLQRCHKLLNCIPSNMTHLFSHLTSLTVSECGCLEEIFKSNDYEGDDNSEIQYALRRMDLDYLPKLKHIWNNHGQVLGFKNLEHITIKQCHDLKYVFPDVSVARSLPNLRGIEVKECKKMEEIIRNNSNSDSIQQPKEAKITFPSLLRIELKKLPSLNCFCPSSFSCYVELPWCHEMIIEECPNMETFSHGGTVYTPRLYDFRVDNTRFDEYEEVNEVIRHSK